MKNEDNIFAICVATYKRPELLKDCLSNIQLLNIPKYNNAVVLVVDNDANQTARTVVDTVTNNLWM